MIPLAEKRWNCLNSISKLWVFREFFCLHVCNCFVQPTDFQNTPFRTHVFRKIRSSGTQLFLHLMRYIPASIKTKSAYISSGLRPVKLVVTGFWLCPDGDDDSVPSGYCALEFRKDFLLHIGSISCFLAFLSLPAASDNQRRYASECIADCPFAAPVFYAMSP